MDNQEHELYENAARRLRQKKRFYFHFVLFFIGSMFFSIAIYFFDIAKTDRWTLWIFFLWFFFLIYHFVKVFITDSLMDKNWERKQIDKMIAHQKSRIQELNELNKDPQKQE